MDQQGIHHHLFGIEDAGRLVWLNSVEVSPDGTMFAVGITERDVPNNTLADAFYVISEAGEHLHYVAGSSPVFSPDGHHIAFEANGALYIYNIFSKDCRMLATIYSSEYFMGHMADKNMAWSPDSKCIAYISTDPFKDIEPPSQQVISRLLYKTKGGRGRNKFADDRLSHIWLVPVDTGVPRCITPGIYNEHSISWSPDGISIAFISDRSGDHDRTHSNDLLAVNVNTGIINTIITGRGTRFKPRWSPAGNLIAFLADNNRFTSKDSPAPDVQVYVVALDGQHVNCLTAPLFRRTDNVKWNQAGDTIYFTAGDHGSTSLYRVGVFVGHIDKEIHGNFLVKDFSVYDNGDKVAFVRNKINEPDEVFISSITQRGIKRVSSFNEPVSSLQLADAETFWFNANDQTPVQGWLMKPASFTQGERYPLVLVIHGGPHNMYGYEFDEKMQLLSAAGYGVVFFNPRGSTGYGQDFTNGNLLNWGGKDYEDIMAGMQYVLQHYSWTDENRLGVTGQSYGGFMTNWIITQTNLFKAAVSDGGISNLISFAGTSLYHCLIEAEFNGDTWDNYPLLWQWSPLNYVKAVTTPTLLLHGENDNEVPVSQAEEMFSALKRLGIETMLVRYMDEGHGWRPDLLPANRIDGFNRMTGWFDKYLK